MKKELGKLKLTTFSIFRTIIVITCLVLVGCNDSANEVAENTFININDPELVANSIVIPNSIKERGDIPASTNNTEAPVLYNEGENFGAIAGRSFYMNPTLADGEAAGIYFKINGSESFFKLQFENESSTEGGRFGSQAKKFGFLKNARVSSSDVIEIQLPKNLSEGSFCAQYAVFDHNGSISNRLPICIEVINEGGDGSEFLVKNDWELVELSESSSGYEFTQSLGEEFSIAYEISVQCADETYQTIMVDEIKKINQFDLRFSSKGEYDYHEESYMKYLDWENSNCNQLFYLEDIIKTSEKGAWSFNKSTDILTVVTEHMIGEKTFTQLFKVKALMEGDHLIISQDFEGGGTYKLVMRKK